MKHRGIVTAKEIACTSQPGGFWSMNVRTNQATNSVQTKVRGNESEAMIVRTPKVITNIHEKPLNPKIRIWRPFAPIALVTGRSDDEEAEAI